MISFGEPDADRVWLTCPKCHGARQFKRYKPGPLPPVSFREYEFDDSSIEIEVEFVVCDTCGGEGSVTVANGDRVDVVRRGKVIGSCLVPARHSRSFLYDRRIGDMVAKVFEGRMVYEASETLCPGDLELYFGFRWIEK